jgi:hypothetical protein
VNDCILVVGLNLSNRYRYAGIWFQLHLFDFYVASTIRYHLVALLVLVFTSNRSSCLLCTCLQLVFNQACPSNRICSCFSLLLSSSVSSSGFSCLQSFSYEHLLLHLQGPSLFRVSRLRRLVLARLFLVGLCPVGRMRCLWSGCFPLLRVTVKVAFIRQTIIYIYIFIYSLVFISIIVSDICVDHRQEVGICIDDKLRQLAARWVARSTRTM